MTTQIHDSTTCTAGLNGAPCEMCQFAQNARQTIAGLFRAEQGVKIDSSPSQTPGMAVSEAVATPDFEQEWLHAPRTHTRHTEQSEAEWWFQRGLWLGIQYERERGLLAINGDLREMQRIARERMGR